MKKIEELIDQGEILNEMLQENKNFDLEDFFVNDRDGGLIIVTPNQNVCLYSIDSHGDVLQKAYQIIYPSFNGFDIQNHISSNDKIISWQEQSCNMGNVLYQLASRVSSFVWLPESINDYQFSQIKILDKFMENLNKRRILNGEKTFEIRYIYKGKFVEDKKVDNLLYSIIDNETIYNEEILLNDLKMKSIKR